MIMKILEQYNKYKIIPASKNIIYHWVTRERLKNFGNLNKDKIFYVIRSIDDESKFYIGPKNNLLANYFYVLSHLQYAIKNKWIPIIDQKNYPVYNKVPCLINGTMNAWEYFWQQPSNYKLEEVYASKNVVLSKRNWFSEWDMGYDASKYLSDYYQKGILDQDPFATVDQDGVGKLIDMAATLGRKTRSDLELGICGEHGGDPKTIDFCHRVGLNYVSCSPFRVPVARLAAAQAAIKSAAKNQ